MASEHRIVVAHFCPHAVASGESSRPIAELHGRRPRRPPHSVPAVSRGAAHWIRFAREGGDVGIGTLEGDTIHVHSGDMFVGAVPTDERVALGSVDVLLPCVPTKMIALWNNLRAAADKQGWAKGRSSSSAQIGRAHV